MVIIHEFILKFFFPVWICLLLFALVVLSKTPPPENLSWRERARLPFMDRNKLRATFQERIGEYGIAKALNHKRGLTFFLLVLLGGTLVLGGLYLVDMSLIMQGIDRVESERISP